jgi:hypothetical protein
MVAWLRRNAFWLGALLGGFVFNVALQKGWLDSFPDGVLIALGVFVAMLFVYGIWHHPTVNKFLRVSYSHKPRMLFWGLLIVGALLGACAGAFGYWSIKRQPATASSSSLFSTEVRSAFVSDSGPLTSFMVGYPTMFGKTASPVFYLAYIQITNLQDVPSTINDLRIAASKESEGPYEDLVQIPLSATTLYWLGAETPYPKTIAMPNGTSRLATPMTKKDMEFAAILSATPILESELAKPLQPRIPVHGWVALDSLRRVGLSPGQIYFRVTLSDSAGKGGRYVVPLPIRQGMADSRMNKDSGSYTVTGLRTNITAFHVKYYGDPFPRATDVTAPTTTAIVRLNDFLEQGTAIQQQLESASRPDEFIIYSKKWDEEIKAYLNGYDKSFAAQFRSVKPDAATRRLATKKASSAWAIIDAKKAQLLAFVVELRQRLGG